VAPVKVNASYDKATIVDQPALSLTEMVMKAYDPHSKIRPSQTGRKRVNLTQLIKIRNVGLQPKRHSIKNEKP
jgi:hypothetical protein